MGRETAAWAAGRGRERPAERKKLGEGRRESEEKNQGEEDAEVEGH